MVEIKIVLTCIFLRFFSQIGRDERTPKEIQISSINVRPDVWFNTYPGIHRKITFSPTYRREFPSSNTPLFES